MARKAASKKKTAAPAEAEKTPAKKSKASKSNPLVEKRFRMFAYTAMILSIVAIVSSIVIYLEKDDNIYFAGLIIAMVVGILSISIWSLILNSRTKSLYALAFLFALVWMVVGLVGLIHWSRFEGVVFIFIGIVNLVFMVISPVRRQFDL